MFLVAAELLSDYEGHGIRAGIRSEFCPHPGSFLCRSMFGYLSFRNCLDEVQVPLFEVSGSIQP